MNLAKRTLLIRRIAQHLAVTGGVMPSFQLFSNRDVRNAARELGCATARGHGHSNRNRDAKQQKKYRPVCVEGI